MTDTFTVDVDDYELEVIQEQQQGPPGPRGIDANTIWAANGPPINSIGEIGDWYISKDAHYLYGPKEATGWPTGVSIIGPQGATGMTGPQGNQVHYGVGAPTWDIGIEGDWYIRAETDYWRLYGPREANGWNASAWVSLVGPSGGRTIMYGTGAPSAGTGIDGDFYIRTDNNYIYGPKASGTWPAGISIVGPTGATGATGPQGPAGGFSVTALAAGSNFNNITAAGAYYTPSGDTAATNTPLASHAWYLQVYPMDANHCLQVATLREVAGATTYRRTKVGGTWGAWHPAVFIDGGQTMTGGFSLAPYNIGNIASSFTPNPANGNYQYGSNNAAFTLNAPASDCAIDILVTNTSTAGLISFSGYTAASGNTGDNLTTTDTQKFIISILRINSVSTYMIKALQ